jgi:hypothetical protein
MKYFFITLIFLILDSCNSNKLNNDNNKVNSNGTVPSDAFYLKPNEISQLQNEILTTGDTSKYLKAQNYFINSAKYDMFLYYSLIMANKYKYNLAFYDVYIALTHPRTGESFKELDKSTQNLALYYLVKSYELGLLSSSYDIKSIIGENTHFPSSSHYLTEYSLSNGSMSK